MGWDFVCAQPSEHRTSLGVSEGGGLLTALAVGLPGLVWRPLPLRDSQCLRWEGVSVWYLILATRVPFSANSPGV